MKFYYLVIILIFFGCSNKKKYHSSVKTEIEVSKSDALQDVLKFQDELDKEFKHPDTSPLPDRYRKDFEGLNFFKPDTNYRVMAKFVATPEALPFMMSTTTDRQSEEVVYGIAYFSLNGSDHELEVYQSRELLLEEEYDDYLFLPFLDITNGEETYAGGRYIDLTIPKDNSIIIDFNMAYNPYCAYNKKFSCPIVPKVNHLNTEIKAGVKAFKPEGK